MKYLNWGHRRMPIYEFECPKHGRFEVYSKKPDPPDCTSCKDETCPRVALLVPSLSTMMPDTHWSGVETQLGYSTSKSKQKRIMKEKGYVEADSQDAEAIRRKANSVKPERLKKNRKELREFLKKEIAPQLGEAVD